jgi:hypothetical protein
MASDIAAVIRKAVGVGDVAVTVLPSQCFEEVTLGEFPEVNHRKHVSIALHLLAES